MPEIRRLEQDALRQIYRTNMREDFPLMELRPWFSVERAWERGGYAAYGYCEDGKLLAYACFYSCGETPFVLLDYFAVIPSLRGQGIGSAFLRELLPEVPAGMGILIEAEREESAKNEEEREIRSKRIAFYRRNGAEKTGVGCHLFGVDYNILCVPAAQGAERTPEEYYDAVCGMYREVYRPVYGRLCRPYLQDGEEEAPPE